ncbi:hypothetical protein AXG93_115s1110 [Marchantia polymorpha subsp. ruderalis]|uniref:Uncharacterized protein n=1 Tax=Marchantia polymorpha subsp. ruderalis TaxID=1480154 RepID=A0A176W7H6_MARPO|nr:hypothetical protein AXG93_115s1110 [Marchantia polymorpha subsp. ruderalis]
MLSESGLRGEFWAEAINTAVYLVKSIVREFDHCITNDLSQEGTPVHQEQEKHERVSIDEPIAIVSDDRDQPDTSTTRSHCASRAPARFGVWANSSILKDNDFDVEDEDGMALILEESEPSSYKEAQALVNKLEWNAAMDGRWNP